MGAELKVHVLKRRIEKWNSDWNELDLSEFDAITLDSAKLISGIKGGTVRLDGLPLISDEIASLLALQVGSLHLYGLTQLTEASAAVLAKHDGYLYLGLKSISDAAAMELSKGVSPMKLLELETLDFTEGHIALAKKLYEDKTDFPMNVNNFSEDLLKMFPKFGDRR